LKAGERWSSPREEILLDAARIFLFPMQMLHLVALMLNALCIVDRHRDVAR
jgi:hypothetical protein